MKSVWPGLVGLVFTIAGAFYYDAHSEELISRAVTAGIISAPASAGEDEVVAGAAAADVKDAAVTPSADEPSASTSIALTVK